MGKTRKASTKREDLRNKRTPEEILKKIHQNLEKGEYLESGLFKSKNFEAIS